MIKKFKFTLMTSKLGSQVSEIVELEFDDDETQDDINEVVSETYAEWVNERNYGGYEEVK